MTMIDTISKSIDYIEANLHSDIGVADVANAVCYSQFYFSRQFSLHTHISVYDYILKRKLSEAYKTLFSEAPRIIDLALQYGFQSHEVFTRAFRKMFGKNPSEVSVMKRLLVFERIDNAYLNFLHDLRIERLNDAYADCFFEVNAKAEFEKTRSLLIILSEDMADCQTTLNGRLLLEPSRLLCISLCGLHAVLRLYHTNVHFAIRYFTDNFFDADRMAGNIILLNKNSNYIDIIIRNK